MGMFGWEKVRAEGYFPFYAEPPFEDEQILARFWGRRWGAWDEAGTLRLVLVHRPQEEEILCIKDGVYDKEMDWRYDPGSRWLWPGKDLPDLALMQQQHDGLVEILKNEGIEVVNLDGVVPPGDGKHCMACMSRDYAVAVPGGAIVCRMGQERRRGEEVLVARKIASLGMPILRTIHGTGVFEGGNFIQLNRENAIVGRGGLTNDEGERQVEEVLNVLGIGLIRVPVPHQDEHIDGRVAVVGKNMVLVDAGHMPHDFVWLLRDLGIRVIPTSEGDSVNVLVLRPGKILTTNMSDKTTKILKAEGIEVLTHEMGELSKALGGVRCSTCPLVRDPA